MLKRTVTFIVSLFVISVLAPSCEYETITPEKIVISETVKYTTEIAPVLENNCSRCHKSTPDFRAANSYTSLKDNGFVEKPGNTSILYTRISSGHNSQNISAEDRAKILKWIDDGAENN